MSSQPAPNKYDLIVIGSGPAGEKGAAQAAYFGKRVAIIEKAKQVGGAIAQTAVPGKGLRETSLFINGFKQRELTSLQLHKQELHVGEILHRSNAMRQSLIGWVEQNIDRHNIDLYTGTATFQDAHTICITQEGASDLVLTGEVILIATGSQPVTPRSFPFDAGNVFNSSTIFSMGVIPKSILFVGTGTIGCEYACIFRNLGVEVTMVGAGDTLFPFADGEISARLKQSMEAIGIRFCLSDLVQNMEADGQSVTSVLQSGETVTTDAAFIAVGRYSNTKTLQLEKAGVTTKENGEITVNERFRTNVPNIYAAGDVIGFPRLASTSMEQARLAMIDAFKLEYKKDIAHLLPIGIWTIPELAMVGETEESLRTKDQPYVVGRASYKDNPRGMLIGDEGGLLKLIFSYPETKLLGVHITGEQACELLSPGMIAITMGADFSTFIEAGFNFPSLSDMYKYATYDAMNNFKKRAAQSDS